MPRVFPVGCETALRTRHVVRIALNVLCIVRFRVSRAVRTRVLPPKCNVSHGLLHNVSADRSGNGGGGSGVNLTLSASPPVVMPTTEPSL